MEELLMRIFKTILGVIGSAALLTAATAEPAAAQTFDRVTKLTFTAPVELPGMTLPAGTYTFRLVDSESDRHVVHVLDADDKNHITTLHAMPTSRSEASEVTVVTFRETAADAPLPIRFWYYPNDRMGQEFAYPKDRAMAIAAATGESVLAIEDNEISRVEAAPAPVEPAPVVEPVEPVEPVAVEPAPQPVATAGELPDTASPLPLVGLIGLVALGGGLVSRAYRRSAV
jgi:hypothetical protein